MTNRIFTFRSGYTVGVKSTYSAKLLELTTMAWDEKNKRPDPPVRSVPIRGGTREIDQLNDPEYQSAMILWLDKRNTFVRDAKLLLALDPASIDKEVVESARKFYEEQGLELPGSDVLLYVTVVADTGSQMGYEFALMSQLIDAAKAYEAREKTPLLTADTIKYLEEIVKTNSGEPGTEDFKEDEWAMLGRFIDLETGPSAALVEHFLKRTFPGRVVEQSNGEVSEHLGSSAKPAKKATSKAA